MADLTWNVISLWQLTVFMIFRFYPSYCNKLTILIFSGYRPK